MAANPKYQPRMSVEEYLAFERASETKHEYWQGEIIDMAGASLYHNIIKDNTAAHIHSQFRGRPCIVVTSDMKVRTSERSYVYPDVVIVCGKPVLADDQRDVLLNPTALIEVFSPSTKEYDLTEKLQAYMAVPSVQEIVFIAQQRSHVIAYTRRSETQWLLDQAFDIQATIELKTAKVALPLHVIYNGVQFDEAE